MRCVLSVYREPVTCSLPYPVGSVAPLKFQHPVTGSIVTFCNSRSVSVFRMNYSNVVTSMGQANA